MSVYALLNSNTFLLINFIVLHRMGFNGRECILQALCESSQIFDKRRRTMVQELIRTVFSMPKSNVLPFEHSDLMIYDKAYRSGQRKAANCEMSHHNCGFSLIKLILGKYSKPSSPYIFMWRLKLIKLKKFLCIDWNKFSAYQIPVEISPIESIKMSLQDALEWEFLFAYQFNILTLFTRFVIIIVRNGGNVNKSKYVYSLASYMGRCEKISSLSMWV